MVQHVVCTNTRLLNDTPMHIHPCTYLRAPNGLVVVVRRIRRRRCSRGSRVGAGRRYSSNFTVAALVLLLLKVLIRQRRRRQRREAATVAGVGRGFVVEHGLVGGKDHFAPLVPEHAAELSNHVQAVLMQYIGV